MKLHELVGQERSNLNMLFEACEDSKKCSKVWIVRSVPSIGCFGDISDIIIMFENDVVVMVSERLEITEGANIRNPVVEKFQAYIGNEISKIDTLDSYLNRDKEFIELSIRLRSWHG